MPTHRSLALVNAPSCLALIGNLRRRRRKANLLLPDWVSPAPFAAELRAPSQKFHQSVIVASCGKGTLRMLAHVHHAQEKTIMGFKFLKTAAACAMIGLIWTAGMAQASATSPPADAKAVPSDDAALLRVLYENGTITRAQYERLKAQYERQHAEKKRFYGPETAAISKERQTTISMKTYVDTSYINSRGGGVKNATSGFGADVKRFYVTIGHSFNDIFSARFRSDVESGDSVAHPNEYSVYVKNAWVQAKFNPAFALRLGIADLPWVPYVENLYGYRYVERVLTDRTHFATSADLGLHALGKFGNGLFDYQASVVNGGGYHDVKRSKTADVSARLGIHPNTNLTIAVGAREGKLGTESYPGTASTPRTAQRYDAVVAWVNGGYRLGLDGFYAKNYSSIIVTGAAPADTASGYSGWISVPLTANGKIAVFARYDYVKPHRLANPDMTDQYANFGIQFHPADPLSISLVYKFERIDQGNRKTGYNATNIKAIGVPKANAYYNEIGIFAQYAF